MSAPLTMPWRHSPEVVGQALELGDAGWTAPQIARILAGRGHEVSSSSIRRWLDPKLNERNRKASRERERRRRAELRAARPADPLAGMTGLARKVAALEARVAALEERAA